MEIRKLLTYGFSPNVGPLNVFRIVSGSALAIAPWILLQSPQMVAVLLTITGIVWAGTGILSRCGVYYLLGHSTCPEADGNLLNS